MKLSSVCPSVCLSHHSACRPPHAAVVGLLLWDRQAENIDRPLHGRALSNKCEQCQLT